MPRPRPTTNARAAMLRQRNVLIISEDEVVEETAAEEDDGCSVREALSARSSDAIFFGS